MSTDPQVYAERRVLTIRPPVLQTPCDAVRVTFVFRLELVLACLPVSPGHDVRDQFIVLAELGQRLEDKVSDEQ